MSVQGDLFGVWEVTQPIQAADATRSISLTCWESCSHCNPELHSRKRHVYRMCDRIGSECFSTSKICEWSDLFDEVKPMSSGWEDY